MATKFHLTPDAANAPQDLELPTLRLNLADGATMLRGSRDSAASSHQERIARKTRSVTSH
jgi:hypothetical protein